MKFIVEKMDGKTFAYFETEKHFKNAQKQRNHLPIITREQLDTECELDVYPDNCYIVIDVKK